MGSIVIKTGLFKNARRNFLWWIRLWTRFVYPFNNLSMPNFFSWLQPDTKECKLKQLCGRIHNRFIFAPLVFLALIPFTSIVMVTFRVSLSLFLLITQHKTRELSVITPLRYAMVNWQKLVLFLVPRSSQVGY